jgi:hypothetical protein
MQSLFPDRTSHLLNSFVQHGTRHRYSTNCKPASFNADA